MLSAHEAVMEITVLQCRHPHEHTPGVMSGTGDITPPGPSRQRRGKATASTDSDQNKKYFKNKELTTNQELYSQSNRLATHRCPQNSSTSNSNYWTPYRELGLGRTARHQCAVVYTVRYTETHQVLKHKAQQRNLQLPSTNISGNRGSESSRALCSRRDEPGRNSKPWPQCQALPLRPNSAPTSTIDSFGSLFGWTSAISNCTMDTHYKITIFPSLLKDLNARFRSASLCCQKKKEASHL